jgi:hypothetical protein
VCYDKVDWVLPLCFAGRYWCAGHALHRSPVCTELPGGFVFGVLAGFFFITLTGKNKRNYHLQE